MTTRASLRLRWAMRSVLSEASLVAGDIGLHHLSDWLWDAGRLTQTAPVNRTSEHQRSAHF